MQIMQAPTRLPGENLTEMLRARVKPEQMQQARHNAYLCGMTVSEFVRYRLFGRVAGAAPAGLHPRIVRTLHSFGFKLQRQISALRNGKTGHGSDGCQIFLSQQKYQLIQPQRPLAYAWNGCSDFCSDFQAT